MLAQKMKLLPLRNSTASSNTRLSNWSYPLSVPDTIHKKKNINLTSNNHKASLCGRTNLLRHALCIKSKINKQ